MSLARQSILGGLLKDRAFVIAAVVMLASAVGWISVTGALKLMLTKAAVPWPEHVVVDDGWRNTSFPTAFGPFVRAGDGELNIDRSGKPIKDGLDDGENIQTLDVLKDLFTGAGLTQEKRKERSSDWYLSRIYSDSRLSGSEPYCKYWSLDITYYTGGLDTVPHISSTCLVAAGATILDEKDFQVTVSNAPEPWNKPLTLKRVLFNAKGRQFLQYYLFSINGQPESSREVVRAKLTNPLQKYVYFAKVQIAPRYPVTDETEMDKRTREFINYCLPVVLKDLSMPSDVQRLESADRPHK
jgi:hypothetical protein